LGPSLGFVGRFAAIEAYAGAPTVFLRELVLCYALPGLNLSLQEPVTMEWTTPQHEEIDLNCEVSSYANAEL